MAYWPTKVTSVRTAHPTQTSLSRKGFLIELEVQRWGRFWGVAQCGCLPTTMMLPARRFFFLFIIAFCSVGFHPRLHVVIRDSSSTLSQHQAKKKRSISHSSPQSLGFLLNPVLSLASSQLISLLGPDHRNAILQEKDIFLKLESHLVHKERRWGTYGSPVKLENYPWKAGEGILER